MKLISFTIPCYNSEGYMEKCIKSILPGKDDVEIIIVDDGSTDKTGEIAERYKDEYPNIVRVIHQENGGHGEAVNTGLKNATGLYFKVVDSDDWIDLEAYKKVLSILKRFEEENNPIDMLLTNYVYEKLTTGHERRMIYTPLFPQDRVIGWKDMKRVIKGFTILMHSVTYRTELLRKCKLQLPKHTFYVDNLFVYIPLPYVKKIYYANIEFYRYYIGREGQSIQEQTMIKRIDQQLRVNKMIIDAYDVWSFDEPKLRKYMLSFLEMITTVSTLLGCLSGTKENLKKVKDLWKYVHKTAPRTFWHMRLGLFGMASNLPGKLGRKIYIMLYKISQKYVGFN